MCTHRGLPGCTVVRNLPANAGVARDAGSVPGVGRSCREEVATHCNILAGITSWTEEPGGLQNTGSERGRRNWETELSCAYTYKYTHNRISPSHRRMRSTYHM